MPVHGTAVAVIVPEPVAASAPPVSMLRVAVEEPDCTPANGMVVAAIEPVPVADIEAPLPTTIEAEVLVPD